MKLYWPHPQMEDTVVLVVPRREAAELGASILHQLVGENPSGHIDPIKVSAMGEELPLLLSVGGDEMHLVQTDDAVTLTVPPSDAVELAASIAKQLGLNGTGIPLQRVRVGGVLPYFVLSVHDEAVS